jgi:hypothetical protein
MVTSGSAERFPVDPEDAARRGSIRAREEESQPRLRWIRPGILFASSYKGSSREWNITYARSQHEIRSRSLGYLHSPYWHLFTAFVGLNLLQSAFTHWCLMERILERSGIARHSSA